MISFFRRIRKNIIRETQTTRYILYAIGEIILVVIGILIALQINNWNEDRKDRQFEAEILYKISEDVREDISKYKSILEAQDGYKKNIDSFLYIVRNPNKYQTTDLDKYYKSLWYFERFTPDKSAITNLTSSGKINIIENDTLLSQIQDYYKTIEEQSSSVDEALASYSRNEIGPYFMRFDFMDSESVNSENRKRKSLLEYHQNPAVENLILARLQLMNTQKAYYLRQIKNANKLINNINTEIHKEL